VDLPKILKILKILKKITIQRSFFHFVGFSSPFFISTYANGTVVVQAVDDLLTA